MSQTLESRLSGTSGICRSSFEKVEAERKVSKKFVTVKEKKALWKGFKNTINPLIEPPPLNRRPSNKSTSKQNAKVP